MTWTHRGDYLTLTDGPVTIDWTPEDGARVSVALDSVGPIAAAAALAKARSLAMTCEESARTVWEKACSV